MLRLSIVMAIFAFSASMLAQDYGIGKEYIAPLHYPKFSITGEYEVNRKFHGFADPSLRMDLERRFDGTLSMEAGLFKYFNAGANFGGSIQSFKKPVHLRLGLFAKPILPLGERFAFFARLQAGISVDLAFYPAAMEFYSSFDNDGNFTRVYKGQRYAGLPFSGFGSATAGIEFFPFSRLGFALEWGIRATLLHTRRYMPLVSDPPIVKGAPDSFNFMTYELPVMATLHIII